jgi:hypothetical protein
MSGFGVTALLMTNGRSMHIRKEAWVKNMTMNFWPEAKRVMAGTESVKDFLVRISKSFGVLVVDISAYNSNNSMVSVSKLYPGKEKASVVLVKVSGALSLLTIGSKTLHEYRLNGHDTFRKSRVPFMINDELESINLSL